MVRILQTNLQRKARAHDLAMATCMQKGVDILIVSEPNRKTIQGGRWLKDSNADVAVYILNRTANVFGTKLGQSMVTIDLGFVNITCCYFSPNAHWDVFRRSLEEVADVVCPGKEWMILGDVNAKSPIWGAPVSDARGEAVVECLDALDMTVINDGKVPTWSRGSQSSFIDLTASTAATARKISDWEVMEVENLSDHRYIMFDVGVKLRAKYMDKVRPVMDMRQLIRAVEGELTGMRGGSVGVQEVTEALKRAQDLATIRRRGREVKLPYWWTTEIEEARVASLRTRRRLTRSRGTDRVETENEYKSAKKRLTTLIRQAKRSRWKDVLNSLEDDIWGQGYRIATRGVRGDDTPYEIPQEIKKQIARQLFPVVEDILVTHEGALETMAPFSEEETASAADSLKCGKSPGPDGIVAETVKAAVAVAPDMIAGLFNGLAEGGLFPTPWKVARLVLIWKGKYPIEAPGSQRPICIMDTLGKLYELMLRGRLERELPISGGLSDRQFGFRKGRCRNRWRMLGGSDTALWPSWMLKTRLTRPGGAL